MTNHDKPMSIEEENRRLYIEQATELPPEHIDDEILSLARDQAAMNAENQSVNLHDKLVSISANKRYQGQEGGRLQQKTTKHGWRKRVWPLSSAASILLVVGILVINQQWSPVEQTSSVPNLAQYQDGAEETDLARINLDAPIQAMQAGEAINSEATGLMQNMDAEVLSPQNTAVANRGSGATIMASQVGKQSAKRSAGRESKVSRVNYSDELAKKLAVEQPTLIVLIERLDDAMSDKRMFDAQVINQYMLSQYPELSSLSQEQQSKLTDLRHQLQQIELEKESKRELNIERKEGLPSIQ